MKNKILLAASVIILSMSMAACGKEEAPSSSTGEGKTLDIQLPDDLIKNTSLSESRTEEETEAAEPENSNDKKFDCLPEIAEASIDSGKFQIDDMVFTIGAPVQEIFDALENSECTYEYDYTPNALIAKGEGTGVQLTFKKNGKDYIFFYVYNYSDATCDLKDCIIVMGHAIGERVENAYYAGNITQGVSYDEIAAKLSDYEIVEEKSDSVKQEYTVKYRMHFTLSPNKSHSLELTFDSNSRVLKNWGIRA